MKKEINIADHNLVPKHIKLTEKEKQELLDRYNISMKELPKIVKGDPAIRPLNAKAGDVIKIIRKSPTRGATIFYRGVANA